VPPIASANVTIGAASAQSAALNAATELLRLSTDAACYLVFGADPTATTDGVFMGAGTTEYFRVLPKSGIKVAVIQA
jgi:hypothetical protein